jgi:predicted transcriptional regulator
MPAKAKTRKPSPAAPAGDRPSAPKAIKVGKRLEKVAREIKDADEFVEHVAGLANRYRREYALQAGEAQAELRQSLRSFQKHAAALASWLQEANNGKATAIERKAFDAIGTKLQGSPVLARPQSVQVLEWLTRAGQVAEESAARKTSADNPPLRIAAEGLRATFEHHKLKVSLSGGDQPADAVRLLCAIARDAGDAAVEPDVAKAALRAK